MKNKLKPPELYRLSDGYNNGDVGTIVPYEVTLYNSGIIVKKSPHPVVADHMKICKMGRTIIGHDSWPIGFNFITFHYCKVDHEKHVDFIENQFMFREDKPEITYEACSDLKVGDMECPRFHTKEEAYLHCMLLMKKEFAITAENNTNRCIKII